MIIDILFVLITIALVVGIIRGWLELIKNDKKI